MRTQIGFAAVAVAGLFTLGCGPTPQEASAALSLTPLEQELTIPASERIRLRTQGCGIAPTADFILDGAIDVGAVSGRLEFREEGGGVALAQLAGTGDMAAAVQTDHVRLPASAPSAQKFDPMITVQLEDQSGNPLGDPYSLGRCSAGGGSFELKVPVRGTGTLQPIGLDCDAPQGTKLELEGHVTLPAVRARFDMIDRDNLVQANARLNIIPEGQRLELPRTVVYGPAGDPTLWAQFVDANQSPISEPVNIGRCGGR
jgi:hypothetical protein